MGGGGGGVGDVGGSGGGGVCGDGVVCAGAKRFVLIDYR